MLIRSLADTDVQPWFAMRAALWPTYAVEYLEFGARDIMQRAERCAVFMAEDEAGKLVGFVEASIRFYADGSETRDVGYVEGWYVAPDTRRQGIGRRLVAAAETWVRTKGCREMASDCYVDNDVSAAARARLGFEETERLIHFRKPL